MVTTGARKAPLGRYKVSACPAAQVSEAHLSTYMSESSQKISGRYLLNSSLCTTYGRTPGLILVLCCYIIIFDNRSNLGCTLKIVSHLFCIDVKISLRFSYLYDLPILQSIRTNKQTINPKNPCVLIYLIY